MWWIEFGDFTTIGTPESAHSDSCGSIGIDSKILMPRSLASSSVLLGYIWSFSAQLVQMIWLIFSIKPISGIFSVWYISAPRFVTFKAAFCGVLTNMVPVIGTFWASDKCMSPVPGGVSTIKISSNFECD